METVQGFCCGLLIAGMILGFILMAVGKHEETKDAMKDGGLKLLTWWLKR